MDDERRLIKLNRPLQIHGEARPLASFLHGSWGIAFVSRRRELGFDGALGRACALCLTTQLHCVLRQRSALRHLRGRSRFCSLWRGCLRGLLGTIDLAGAANGVAHDRVIGLSRGGFSEREREKNLP